MFIFTLVEDGVVDTTIDSIRHALERTLLFSNPRNIELPTAILGLSQKFAIVGSQIESSRLRRFNTSGMHYRSNLALERRSQHIAKRCEGLAFDEYYFDKVIASDDLQFIIENIREAQISQQEYRQQYKTIKELDHYGLLVAWISGGDFSVIRDKFFKSIKDIAQRTATCQSYIAKMFTFKLPWAFAALSEHAKPFSNMLLNFWLETIPAQVKYGVNTPEAVFLSSVGIQSRILAIQLAELYRREIGSISDTNWQPLEDWFLRLSPFDLREKMPDLPDLAIRQAIRRINSIRRPSKQLLFSRRIVFNVAGWQHYNGEFFFDQLYEKTWGNDKPIIHLFHDFNNDYDEYAVSLHFGTPSRETQIGYVPRAHNEEIAEMITLGRNLNARIITMAATKSLDGWRRVEVEVELI